MTSSLGPRRMKLPPPEGKKALDGQVLEVLSSGCAELDMPDTHPCGDAE